MGAEIEGSRNLKGMVTKLIFCSAKLQNTIHNSCVVLKIDI